MYLIDPKDGKQSVTLTFMVVSYILVTGFSVAVTLEKVPAAGPLMELFYACSALYFGRRVSFGNKVFSGKEESKEKSE